MKKEKLLQIRIPERLLDALKKEARTYSMSLSEYVRETLLERVVEEGNYNPKVRKDQSNEV